MSRDHVVAVLDLINYTEFLANYDPSDMGPLKPQEADNIYYEDTEVIARDFYDSQQSRPQEPHDLRQNSETCA